MNAEQKKAMKKIVELAKTGDTLCQAIARHKGWDFEESSVSKALLPEYRRMLEEAEIIKARYPGMTIKQILALFDKTTEAA